MTKKILSLAIAFVMIFTFAGCNSEETVIIEEYSQKEGDTVPQNNTSSDVSQNNESVDTPVSSESSTESSQPDDSSKEPTSEPTQPETPDTPDTETIDIDYEWKSHPEDYKLIAFTFDDGPSANMTPLVNLFSYYEGAGTFFVTGKSPKGNTEYIWMQNAINYGWAIGNHGDNHLVAAGLNGVPATYDEIKADINNLTHKLETNLKNIDGTPYKVNFYRPPNIKPTANTFKICGEENLAVIWLKHDSLDWDKSKTYNERYSIFKNGIGTWEDGDIILCHETGVVANEEVYKILEELLPEFYRAGYRFCSISELMEMRGVSIDEISGELKDVNGNQGMVTNVLDAAKAGKK